VGTRAVKSSCASHEFPLEGTLGFPEVYVCLALLLMKLLIHTWASEVHLSIFCSKYLGWCGLVHIIYCMPIFDIKHTLQ